MNIREKIFNKMGYYRQASDKYYLSMEDDKPVVVDSERFKTTHQFNETKVQDSIKQLLIGMGEDINRPGLLETPRRVMGYWKELLQGEQYSNEQIADMYNKSFIVPSDSIVVLQVNNVFSNCEHHLALMFDGIAYVAYIPKRVRGGYRVLGLSKIPRIVYMCAKRLQLQEKLASDIAECITLATGSEQVYVQLIMNHGCVSARGVNSDSRTDVTYMSEKLKRNKKARREIETKIQNMYK